MKTPEEWQELYAEDQSDKRLFSKPRQLTHRNGDYIRAIQQDAIADKDKEISELRSQMRNDFMAGVVIEKDKRIAELQKSFQMSGDARKEWLAEFDGYRARLIEAQNLIEWISITCIERTDIITAAKKWLEGKT